MKVVGSDARGLAEAAEALRAGEVVAYPTETVYGLGVDPFSEAAVERLFALKGRAPDNPVLLVAADLAQVEAVVSELSPKALVCADAFWPGPLSLLLSRSGKLPEVVTAGLPKVCVRCTADDVARRLCQAFGGALTSTSANVSGGAPACCLEDIKLDGITIGVDGGKLDASLPSTVYDPDLDEVVRAGVISEHELRQRMARAEGE